MAGKEYKALIVEEIETNKFTRSIKLRSIDSLPDNDVLIKVNYSALNYKDALSAHGHKGITRHFPFQPGIDAAGTVEESKIDKFKPGDDVIVTGYDLGMNTDGGFGEYIKVPGEWIVPLPENISKREAMIYGTSGFTAGICIYELENHDVTPDRGKILVTGATGGVGSLGVGMLSRAGYEVTASTGKTAQAEFLKKLGASNVIHRDEVFDKTNKPMLPGRWAGAIETVGGNTLSTVIRSTKQRGVVCCLGLVESDDLKVKVYPFILRGVALVGIDSAERPMNTRLKIWENISTKWRIAEPDFIAKEISLEELPREMEKILKGGQVGKILINLNK